MKFGEFMEVSFIPDFTDRLGAYLRGGRELRVFLTEFELEEALTESKHHSCPFHDIWTASACSSGELCKVACSTAEQW